MNMAPYIFWACIIGPAATGILGGAALRSVRRGAVLAATSLLGVLAGVGAWVLVGGYVVGGGPLSLLLGPVTLLCGWLVGIWLAGVLFTRNHRLQESPPGDPPA